MKQTALKILAEELFRLKESHHKLGEAADRATKALKIAAGAFRKYERIHLEKGNAGIPKSKANGRLAKKMEKALAEIAGQKSIYSGK